jgi:hypothetical protein
MKAKHSVMARLITLLFLVMATAAFAADQLGIDVGGAGSEVEEDYFVVILPEEGGGSITVTISGSGNVDPPESGYCKQYCPDGETIKATTDAGADGDLRYTFDYSAGEQYPETGSSITWTISASTEPGEYTFQLTKVEQDYKCPDDYGGETLTKDNTNASKRKTVQVVKLKTQTIATQPDTRTRKTIGVGEEVSLWFEPTPRGNITWTVEEGLSVGSVNPATGAATTFKAGTDDGTGTVKATLAGGQTASAAFTIIAPTGVKMVFDARTAQSDPTIFLGFIFETKIYIAPDNVSFYNCDFKEGQANAVCAGYFDYLQGYPHDMGELVSGKDVVVAGKGTELAGGDQVSGTTKNPGAPYAPGTFVWNLPWSYYVKGNGGRVFTPVEQKSDLQGAGNVGTLKVSKAGADDTMSTP